MNTTRKFLFGVRGKEALCALLLGSALGGCVQTYPPSLACSHSLQLAQYGGLELSPGGK